MGNDFRERTQTDKKCYICNLKPASFIIEVAFDGGETARVKFSVAIDGGDAHIIETDENGILEVPRPKNEIQIALASEKTEIINSDAKPDAGDKEKQADSKKPDNKKPQNMRLIHTARKALNIALPISINSGNYEYGGLICQNPDGSYYATPARTDHDKINVDVGLSKGCPKGKMVAYYHTHAVIKTPIGTMIPEGFSGEPNYTGDGKNGDIGCADLYNVDAFVATLSGKFFYYDHVARKVYPLQEKINTEEKNKNVEKTKTLFIPTSL